MMMMVMVVTMMMIMKTIAIIFIICITSDSGVCKSVGMAVKTSPASTPAPSPFQKINKLAMDTKFKTIIGKCVQYNQFSHPKFLRLLEKTCENRYKQSIVRDSSTNSQWRKLE